jgi:uncharacterized protein
MMTRYSLLKTATFLVFTFFVCLNAKAQAGQTGSLQIVTSKGPVMFAVEYAITPKEKAQGLMYKESVPKSTGMLFIYQTPKEITMWMKNTPVSLDMIFISNRGRVRYIEEKTEPNSTRQIHSHGKVSAVLEVVAGTVEDFGIKVGDEVILGK